MIIYLSIFALSFLLSIILTLIVKKIAIKLKILDYPGHGRKIHKKPTPLLGGIAIFLSFFISIILYNYFFPVFEGSITLTQIYGLFVASTILMIGGYIDDKYDIGTYSFVFPLAAILILLPFNIGIEKITNPFGGVIFLDIYQIKMIAVNDVIYYFTVFVDLFTILWLLGMTYTTKLLDGLDGLVAGITSIGALIIFLLSISDSYYQPDVAVLSLILFGACFGFLIFNFHPAKIFLGEGGSVFTGFMLGILAIISGGKIATALLVMGIPILDIIWVILRRIKNKKSLGMHDSFHLHHRLLYIGLSQRQAVILLYIFSFAFGITTLFLQSLQKIFALLFLGVLMVILGVILVNLYNKKNKSI